jgi:hypothetical protein
LLAAAQKLLKSFLQLCCSSAGLALRAHSSTERQPSFFHCL